MSISAEEMYQLEQTLGVDCKSDIIEKLLEMNRDLKTGFQTLWKMDNESLGEYDQNEARDLIDKFGSPSV